MPLKLNVGASRKVGDANYGSRGASVNLEMELDTGLAHEPDKLQEKIRQLFGLVRTSLAEELKQANAPAAAETGARNGHAGTHTNGANGSNGEAPRRPARPATQSQVKAIHAIAKSQDIDLAGLLRDRFHVGQPGDLSIAQASQLIDELKAGKEHR
jgi:hypothetical protein